MEESKTVLDHLERIDDDADKLDISLVKINDLEVVDDYGLDEIPAIVFYRRAAPILYEGWEL